MLYIFLPCGAKTTVIYNNLPAHSKGANLFYFFMTRKWSKNTHEEFPNILTTTDMFTRNDFVALHGLYENQKAFYYISVCVAQFK